MEALWMLAVLIGVVGWFHLRSRMRFLEGRVEVLAEAVWRVGLAVPVAPAPETPRPEPPRPEPRPARETVSPRQERMAPTSAVLAPPVEPLAPPESGPPIETDGPREERLAPTPTAPAAGQPVPLAPAPESDWEAVLGGSWMNKIGVFVVVVGLALLLNYAYTHMGAAGRVAVSFAGAFAMLGAGMAVERMEKYRTFAYGLIGGGWAALYLTTFALHAIPAAKILDNALLAVVLLLAVAAGMIVHSMKYRSQTVTGLAYFIAFATLAISEVTAFSVIAVVPLAASLLWIAHRNEWGQFAVFGVIATYLTVAMHEDTGSPLWETQTLFLVYWMLFEAFDVMRANPWLLPLNAFGFLALSGTKWSHAMPDQMWIFAAGASALYLGSTVVRAQSGRWRPAVTLNAALAAVAIMLKLEGEWRPLGLLMEGEIYYLAGLRFQSQWLRSIGLVVFAVDLGYVTQLRAWERLGIVNAVVFYANRVLRPVDVFFGYAGAALAALVSGKEVKIEWLGRVWSLMAVGPFAIGWWRRLPDFRAQAYGFAAIGAISTILYLPHPPAALAVGSALAYGLVLCTLWSGEDRFHPAERDRVRAVASFAAAAGAAALLWKLVPDAYLGMAWAGLALLLLEAGLRRLPEEFMWQATVVAVVAFTKCVWHEQPVIATAVAIAFLAAATLRSEQGSPVRLLYSMLSGALLTVLIYQKVTGSMLTIAWGAEGVALLAAGFVVRDRVLRLSGLALLCVCIGKLFFWDLRNLETLPRIVSFIVLGLLLVAVSWVYTRFKDQVSKLL